MQSPAPLQLSSSQSPVWPTASLLGIGDRDSLTREASQVSTSPSTGLQLDSSYHIPTLTSSSIPTPPSSTHSVVPPSRPSPTSLGLPPDALIIPRSQQVFSASTRPAHLPCRTGCVSLPEHALPVRRGLIFALLGTHDLPEWVGVIGEPEHSAQGWTLFRTDAASPFAPQFARAFRICIVAPTAACQFPGQQPSPVSFWARTCTRIPLLRRRLPPGPQLHTWMVGIAPDMDRPTWRDDPSDFFNYARSALDAPDVSRSFDPTVEAMQLARSRTLTGLTVAWLLSNPKPKTSIHNVLSDTRALRIQFLSGARPVVSTVIPSCLAAYVRVIILQRIFPPSQPLEARPPIAC
ncbi:hypothetical protein PsYK624_146930 [Phanerochaete sordida]|uniref:Uncharacterized protein n=1 Tax=Phanerochaete sordida TaxID=48140 RepID=A0A9P3GPG1_9APHY|nr:hypothetical protein PsYK624_146930 [Phanerochaete sordida]